MYEVFQDSDNRRVSQTRLVFPEGPWKPRLRGWPGGEDGQPGQTKVSLECNGDGTSKQKQHIESEGNKNS